MKKIKELLRELGFHHSWGYWIDNEKPQNRICLFSTKNTICIQCTKTDTTFSDGNFCLPKGSDPQLFITKIKTFFNKL